MKKNHAILIVILLFGFCFSAMLACGSNTKKLAAPKNIVANGTSLSWDKVDGALQYNVDISSSQKKTRDTVYSISTLNCKTEYTVKIMALGDGNSVADSQWSQPYVFTTGEEGFSHSMGEWTESPDKPRTCTEEGEERRACVRCDIFETRETEPLGHSMQWIEVTAPTETTDGEEIEKCSRCGETGETRVAHATGTEGLVYTLTSDGSGYRVRGLQVEAKEIYIPEFHNRLPVVEIADGGFSSLSNLEKIVIPNNVVSIGKMALEKCFSLKEIVTPFVGATRATAGESGILGHFFSYSATEAAGTTRQLFELGSFKYYFIPQSLQKVVITDAVSVRYGAFYGCTMLNSVEINCSESIGENAFFGCISLESVKLDGDVSTIGKNAFENCEDLQEVILPDTLQFLERAAFKKCISLEKIRLPKGLITIGNEAFMDCTSLSLIVFPEGLQKIGGATLGEGEYEGRSFYRCTSLTSVTIPESVIDIGAATFGLTGATAFVARASKYPAWSNNWSSGGAMEIGLNSIVWNSVLETEDGEYAGYVVSINKTGSGWATIYTSPARFTDPCRDGYIFLGWSTETDGSGTLKSTQELNSAANELYYSVWQIAT